MKALTVINLPGVGRKMPGDKITKKELSDANQTDEDIQKLKAAGAIGDDNADLHKDHQPIEVKGVDEALNVYASDEGTGGEGN